MRALQGLGVAMITPFTSSGAIDYPAVKKLVEYYHGQGVDYVVVLGTTAESVTLTPEEKSELMAYVHQVNEDKLPLVIGIGGNNTASVVAELQKADLTGYCAILSVCPYYNRPNQEGIFQHFSAIANASPLPVLLYNVPSRTAASIENATCIRLQKAFSSIIGIKDARGDIQLAAELIAETPKDFLVLSGDDASALDLIKQGGDGVISVIGGGMPRAFSECIHKGLNQDFSTAKVELNRLLPLIDLIFKEGNPTGLKALLSIQDRCENQLRLPLVKASVGLQNEIKQAYEDYKSLF